MKVSILSTSDHSGGAARAATRLNTALAKSGIDSTMLVGNKQSDHWRITGPQGKLKKFANQFLPAIENFAAGLQSTTNPAQHSLARTTSIKASTINHSTADLVNIHWICRGFLSIEEIGRITKPLVWTFHDMWPFCGAEHLSTDDAEARWKHGYTKDNRDPAHSGLDIDRYVWLRKQKAWKRPFQIVTPSKWLADCVRGSSLMQSWPVAVIPNPLDTNIFRPHPKELARGLLQLPREAKLIIFGAMDAINDPNKGWDLLSAALRKLRNDASNVHCAIFGQSEPKKSPDIGLPLHWMGVLRDEVTLALLYSAADVMIVPSRIENLPQAGTEAQACGCPVVAFNTCGLKEVVKHGETGYLATPLSSDDLATGINWVLEDEDRHQLLSENARKRAVESWSQEKISALYVELYQHCISAHRAPSGNNREPAKPSYFHTVPGMNRKS